MNYKRPMYMYISFQRCAWMMIIFATDIYGELDWLPFFINVSYNCFNDYKHIIYEQFEKQTTEKTKSNILARIMPPKQGCASYKTHCIVHLTEHTLQSCDKQSKDTSSYR